MATPLLLRNKKIILGVTGCIAAYKSIELLRMLKKAGADVWVVMTKSAKEFATPLTFRTLSGNPCITEMFDPSVTSMPLPHISLADSADLFLVVPATANIIGKAATGIADDLLSTLFLSCECTKIFAPAMNTKMWNNSVVKDNIKKLNKLGSIFIDPEVGELACGDEGEGRLCEIKKIFDAVVKEIGTKQDLAGKKVLITAGGTREAIDPVRFIGNRSSGKMGYALAQAAVERGASVKVISANISLEAPKEAEVESVSTAAEMKNAVLKNYKDTDIIIMAAAVADYRPEAAAKQKIKKDGKDRTVELVPTEDILSALSKIKGNKKLIGFSVESKDLLANSKKKLKEKGLDMIVANDISAFESDESEVLLINRSGKSKIISKQNKAKIAHEIFDNIQAV